jgi:hypothetical protein
MLVAWFEKQVSYKADVVTAHPEHEISCSGLERFVPYQLPQEIKVKINKNLGNTNGFNNVLQ